MKDLKRNTGKIIICYSLESKKIKLTEIFRKHYFLTNDLSLYFEPHPNFLSAIK